MSAIIIITPPPDPKITGQAETYHINVDTEEGMRASEILFKAAYKAQEDE